MNSNDTGKGAQIVIHIHRLIGGLAFAGMLFCLVTGMTATRAAGEQVIWSGDPVTVDEIVVQVDDPYPGGFDWPGLARAVIGLKPGDRLTPDRLERSVALLAPLMKVQTEIRGGLVVFDLEPRKRVKTIDVKGSYPLFDQDVYDAMTMAPGAIFAPEAAAGQADLVARRYEAEGYIDPQVRINWEQDDDDGHYHFTVSIRKGPYYALQQIRLSGNRTFSDIILKPRMKSWRQATLKAGMGRFRARRLKADIDNLLAFYRGQGYADAAITHRLLRDIQRQRISVEIEIDEGPLYDLSFTGNAFFDDDALRKSLTLATDGNRNNSGIYGSVRNIRERYRQAGFFAVQVRHRTDSSADSQGQKNVSIEIDEGRRHLVRSVNIVGTASLDASEVRKQILTLPANGSRNTPYVARVLQEDLAAVQSLYQQKGFLGTLVEEQVSIDPQTQAVDVTISVAEGVRTRVGRVEIQGAPAAAEVDWESLPALKTGDIFRPDSLDRDENRLAARTATLGYPHVRVTGNVEMSADQTSADIVYTIDPGAFVQIGDIFFTGNFRTRSSLMTREAALTPGAPFDLSKVLAAQRNLRDMNLFESVQVRSIGLKEKAGRVPLLVEVVEKKPYYYEVGGGFETAKGLFARSKVGDRNLGGANRQIWLGGEVSGIGHRVDAGLSVPHLLGTRIRADLGVFSEREEAFNKDFGTDSYGGNLNLSRRMSRTIVTALGWRYENRDQFLREVDASDEVDPDALEPRRILVTTPTLWYDSRDSLTRPRKGWYSRFSVDISNGLDNDLDDFLRYRFNLRHFYTLNPRLTLAAMARVGYLTGDGDEDRVPEDQLFFLGGTSDVRGFGENLLRFDADGDPVGGRLALAGSLEARYDLGRNFELTLFTDAGSLQLAADEDDTSESEWRWSVGLGLGYITPIGPISLFYGHKLDPRETESDSQFHFSIGYTF